MLYHKLIRYLLEIMNKKSAGLLLFRKNKFLEILLVHPGGPFWKNKDKGAWSLPKGEFTDEDPLDAAKREFEEETGIVCNGSFIELTPIKQKSGKTVYAWALEKNIDAGKIISNTFEIEWPPKSGQQKVFPEIDKAEWFQIPLAKQKINISQCGFIEELTDILKLK